MTLITAPSEIQGIGVFTTQPISQGSEILQIDDTRTVDADHPLLPGEQAHHRDYLADGREVLMQLPERHINHSCDPNSYVKTIEGVRRVIALRDIAAGDEITGDYAINGVGGVPWDCHCGAARCRGAETWADYFTLPRHSQEEYRPLLDDWFVNEHQERLRALGL